MYTPNLEHIPTQLQTIKYWVRECHRINAFYLPFSPYFQQDGCHSSKRVKRNSVPTSNQTWQTHQVRSFIQLKSPIHIYTIHTKPALKNFMRDQQQPSHLSTIAWQMSCIIRTCSHSWRLRTLSIFMHIVFAEIEKGVWKQSSLMCKLCGPLTFETQSTSSMVSDFTTCKFSSIMDPYIEVCALDSHASFRQSRMVCVGVTY